MSDISVHYNEYGELLDEEHRVVIDQLDQEGQFLHTLVEFAHKSWPLLHWSIASGRKDIAWRALKLFPEQARQKTQKISLIGQSERDNFVMGHEAGISALELAVRAGYHDLAAALIDRGADPDLRRRVTYGEVVNSWRTQHRPLYWREHYVGTIREKAKFPDHDHPWADFEERSLLFWAIRAEDGQMVDLLLKNGASTGVAQWVNRGWRTDEEVREKPVDWADRELPSYAHTGPSEVSKSGVQVAIEQGSNEIAHKILQYELGYLSPRERAPVEESIVEESSIPPLYLGREELERAIAEGDLKRIESLLKRGASCPRPLSLAMEKGDPEVVQFLIDLGVYDEGAMEAAMTYYLGLNTFLEQLIDRYGLSEEKGIALQRRAIEGKQEELLRWLVKEDRPRINLEAVR